MQNHTNKLINEKSPYLLQHAHNPVNWLTWGSEAFIRAKEEDKPVFLSIGYSTCHWCHVMEKESFEDIEVAELLNNFFIPVKVDKEERPDIDAIYMSVCQMLTGSGGWPMTIVMTHDKKPFFAGTYFPKKERFGKPGLLDLLPRINKIWKEQRADILNSAESICSSLEDYINSSATVVQIDEAVLKKASDYFVNAFDKVNGGFGNAPKFPTPHIINFLLSSAYRFGNNDFTSMAELTLNKMRGGGIWDHIGFGFHRYSTDKKWLVPHFEKMLYDQALLCNAYTEAFLATQNQVYKNTAIEIIEYVLRQMTSAEGGFYSAEDADSEGEEGKFYIWKADELRNILSDSEYNTAAELFNIKEDGNFIDPVVGINTGENILHLTVYPQQEAALQGVELQNIINTLYNTRSKRVPPFKDEKILTDWNSLMITALCKAGRAFNEPAFIKAAEKNYSFILTNLSVNGNKLLHRFINGQAAVNGTADDYSFFIWACLELYQATFKLRYLKKAIEFNAYFIENFYDNKQGGFFFTSNESEKMITRNKEIYDGAIPSSNSVAFLNLLRLARLTGNSELEETAFNLQSAFSAAVTKHPAGYTHFLQGVNFSLGPSTEIVLTGNEYDDRLKEMIAVINSASIPASVVILKTPENEKEVGGISPFTKQLPIFKDKPAVFYCNNYTCSSPVHSPEELKNLLSNY